MYIQTASTIVTDVSKADELLDDDDCRIYMYIMYAVTSRTYFSTLNLISLTSFMINLKQK